MKTIAVSVDEETYRLALVKAAEAGTSVSDVLQRCLEELAHGGHGQSSFDRLRRLQDETLEMIYARGGGLGSADNLPREALHRRDELL